MGLGLGLGCKGSVTDSGDLPSSLHGHPLQRRACASLFSLSSRARHYDRACIFWILKGRSLLPAQGMVPVSVPFVPQAIIILFHSIKPLSCSATVIHQANASHCLVSSGRPPFLGFALDRSDPSNNSNMRPASSYYKLPTDLRKREQSISLSDRPIVLPCRLAANMSFVCHRFFENNVCFKACT
jgi:hypothetical protein